MREKNDALYSDVYVCGAEGDWHELYYIAPNSPNRDGLRYQVSRTGVESRTPELFIVERTAETPFCQIFAILSGAGQLTVGGETYPIHGGQVVVLVEGEAHAYRSDPQDPMGLAWLEFCGGDCRRILRYVADRCSPVMEGAIFETVWGHLSALQQKLLVEEDYCPSGEIYQLLLSLLDWCDSPLPGPGRTPFAALRAYLDAHLHQQITNGDMARLCGMSPAHFSKTFKLSFHQTPQEYLMARRINRAKYALTRTDLSVEEIGERLGFCGPSHFIRRFRGSEGMTPAQYRRRYRVL